MGRDDEVKEWIHLEVCAGHVVALPPRPFPLGREVRMGKAPRRRFAAVLLLAGATGCSSFSGGSLTAWMPWPKKQDQGLSWSTPDMSKTYGNQIAAQRG